ncbi:FecR family protein [Chitinophaga lutea]
MDQEFVHLLDGYLTGSLSDAEEQRFFDLLEDPEHRALLESVIDRLAEERSLVGEDDEMLRAQSLRRLQTRLREDQPAAKVRRMPWKAIAAAVLVMAAAGTVWMTLGRREASQPAVAQEIQRANGGATLTLPNGSVVALDSITPDRRAITASREAHQLGANDSTLAPEGEVPVYTVATARGKHFRLMLHDGTVVWLNAASSIRFPVVFPKGIREVEITGEAYFEVAKNAAAPFRVKARQGMLVEVLGTHFNIKAYEDERHITTSLLEGSVRVTQRGEQLVMQPGQQVRAGAGGMNLSEGDVSEAIAWKEGRFELAGNIKEIMRQLQRWYNISSVEYAEGVDSTIFVATVSTSKKLSEVLDILEKTGSIHFKTEGDKVIVMP